MHAEPVVALGVERGLAGMNAHPNLDRRPLRPVVLGEGTLTGHRRGHRLPGCDERDEERIALRTDLEPAVLLECRPEQLVMSREHVRVATT